MCCAPAAPPGTGASEATSIIHLLVYNPHMHAPILLTKIMPPHIPLRTLNRVRLTRRLHSALDYRVTFLQAGAGYGKSTALASLSGSTRPLIWYHIGDGDEDALVFLQHLCHATLRALPELKGSSFPVIDAWDMNNGGMVTRDFIYRYLNAITENLKAHTLIVLDDAHRVSGNPEIIYILNQLIDHAPQELHFVIASRGPITLPSLSNWKARGLVQNLSQSVLAFSKAEIAALFADHYEFELTDEEVNRIFQVTEGWAITLHLIWQSLRRGNLSILENGLARLPDDPGEDDSMEHLFRLLAQDVLSSQPEDVQEFLRVTSTLRTMTVEACDALFDNRASAEKLDYLRRQELFVVPVDDRSLRYHHIFHRFLRQQTPAAEQDMLHRRAGQFYEGSNQSDAAIYHFLRAKDYDRSADLLARHGENLLATGRLDTLSSYLDFLPPEHLSVQPVLLFYLGDLARLRNRYEEALGWYSQAETLWRDQGQTDGVARALRGQARIYLDTVNPARAEDLLQQSLRMTDGTKDREAQARLYELLAENKLNAGKPAEAEQLRQQAEAMRLDGPSDSQLPYRILLRTGRLSEAKKHLLAQLETEREEPVQTPRAHRETNFILALIHTFLGEAEAAFARAKEGTDLGLQLVSPYMTAVGHMRQGHAIMLLPGESRYNDARDHFERAVEISRELSVPRLRVEAHWGLTRAYGYEGNITRAMSFAQEGIEIATQAGDEWVASLIRLAMGSSLTLAGRYEPAETWLNQAARGMDACADPYSATAARLWLVVNAFRKGDQGRVDAALPDLLASCKERDETFLLIRPTLIGLQDERIIVPVLLRARAIGCENEFVDQLLREMSLEDIRFHPGYRLSVTTFGKFQCNLGEREIPDNGWRRQATRQLWQLLINFRDSPLEREQIFEYLWPEGDPDASHRNFKVALNTLYKVIEPGRAPGTESAYIFRDGTLYGIRPEADIVIDADQFLEAINRSEAIPAQNTRKKIYALEHAISLYGGDYLPDARYETWAATRRELLDVHFLKASDELTVLYLSSEQIEKAIRTAQQILAHDSCWERAYRHLMMAYHRLGDIGQVGRTYHRCVDQLAHELDVAPSTETRNLFLALTDGQQQPISG